MFGPTRCVTLSGPQARPTGCALAGSHGEVPSMYMPRYALPCLSACPCLGLGAPARRPLPSSTLRAMLTRPQPSHQPGWRTPTSRYPPRFPGAGAGLWSRGNRGEHPGPGPLGAESRSLRSGKGRRWSARCNSSTQLGCQPGPRGGPLTVLGPPYTSSFLLIALTLECLLSASFIHL